MLTPFCGLRPNSPTATTRVSFKQPAVVQVGQQAREALVEHRARAVAHPAGQVGVVVPRVVVGVGHLGPDDLDDLGAGLDQAAGQQAALAEGVAAVQVAGLGRLGLDVERLAGAARDDQAQRAVVVLVELVGRRRPCRCPACRR